MTEAVMTMPGMVKAGMATYGSLNAMTSATGARAAGDMSGMVGAWDGGGWSVASGISTPSLSTLIPIPMFRRSSFSSHHQLW